MEHHVLFLESHEFVLMGRKTLAPWRVEGTLTGQKAVTMSSAASVAGRLSCSTSLDIAAAEILDVVAQPSTIAVALTGAGGMAVIGSTSTLVYTLPTSTAGTLFHVFWSSGASAILQPGDTTNTKIWGLPGSTYISVSLTGSTGDHVMLIAQSSSQWNILSYSSGIASS